MKVEHRLCANFPYSLHVPQHQGFITPLARDALWPKFRLFLIFASAKCELSNLNFWNTRMQLLKKRQSPHTPRGCPFQARSIREYLRVLSSL